MATSLGSTKLRKRWVSQIYGEPSFKTLKNTQARLISDKQLKI